MKLLIVFLLLSCLIYNAQSNQEVGVLIAIKNELNDTQEQLSNWYPNFISPCEFIGVTCDAGRVTRLTLNAKGFTGTLSPALGNLTYLTDLILGDNKLTGIIPMELGNLSRLGILNLENNFLTGSIPVSFGRLSKLQILILSGNNLTGLIPESVANLSSLSDIEFAFNNLSGQIPASLFLAAKYNFSNNLLDCGVNFPHSCVTADIVLPNGGSHTNTGVILGGISGMLVLLALVMGFVFCNFKRNKHCNSEVFQDVEGENECRISLGQLTKFSLHQLKAATNDFNEEGVLGEGGFGKVYKGTLYDHKGKPIKVAVKRLINVERPGGEEAFQREVELISVAVHRNLLRLLGYCMTPTERLLVYPFMENLSVAHCLRDLKSGKQVLDWPTRKRIALGTAQGLEYLHEHCDPKIIHRDVKAANVMLDADFEAVVGDFGLAQLVDIRKTSVTTLAIMCARLQNENLDPRNILEVKQTLHLFGENTKTAGLLSNLIVVNLLDALIGGVWDNTNKVRGTQGHIAPEYLKTGRSSEKTDVFGFGIMLLELVTGRRTISFEEADEILLHDHVNKLYRENRLDAIIDRRLNGMYDSDGAEMLVQVALLCTQDSPESRPTMSEVVRMLEGEGLPEKWEELQEVQVTHRPTIEIDQLIRNCLINREVRDESLYIPDAIELSGGR